MGTTVIARMTEAMTVTVAEEMKTDSTEVLIGIGIPVTNTIREREEEIDMTIVTEEMMTRRGERTATAAVMTGPGAMIEDIAAETVTVGATVTATVATAAFNCTLMAGVALLMSLVVGRIWIMESETHQSLSIRSARPELPVHMNLLLCPS